MGWFSSSSENTDSAYQAVESIDACIEQSKQTPVILFKHSTTCPVSTYAKREMDAFVSESDVPTYLVIVQTQRPFSNEIAEKLSTRHESPQALYVKDGEVAGVWNHGDITATNLKATIG